MSKRFLIRTSALAASALALLAFGQPGYAGRKTDNTLIGAGIGGVGGALISNGDPLATVGGAAVGGVIGNVATGDHHHRDGEGDYRRNDHRGYDRHDRGYYGGRGRY